MKLSIKDLKTGGYLSLLKGEDSFDRFFYGRDRDNRYFTIAWNHGQKQTVTIDDVAHDFMPNTILPLMFNQSLCFENPTGVVAWQFNREFYCVIDHDAEVSCVGFLFGAGDNLFINLDRNEQQKMQLLLNIFVEELNTSDNIQKD